MKKMVIINGDDIMEVNVYGDAYFHNGNPPIIPSKNSAERALLNNRVKQRDGGKCQICGEEKKQLQVHHIMPQADYPELICDTSNMITLCQSCHTKYHDKYGGVEGAVSFVKYLKENLK